MFSRILIRDMDKGGKHKLNKRKHKSYKNIIVDDIRNNFNNYIKISILFILGICIGVILFNKLDKNQLNDLNTFIIDSLKNPNILSNYNRMLFKKSLIKNTCIILIFWITGLTIYGKYLIYIIISFLGIMLGYATSAVTSCFNLNTSILVILSMFFLQNLILIPTIIFTGTQEIKCQNIFLDTHDLKRLFISVTIIITISWLLLGISSFVEANISSSLIKSVINIL